MLLGSWPKTCRTRCARYAARRFSSTCSPGKRGRSAIDSPHSGVGTAEIGGPSFSTTNDLDGYEIVLIMERRAEVARVYEHAALPGFCAPCLRVAIPPRNIAGVVEIHSR